MIRSEPGTLRVITLRQHNLPHGDAAPREARKVITRQAVPGSDRIIAPRVGLRPPTGGWRSPWKGWLTLWSRGTRASWPFGSSARHRQIARADGHPCAAS